MNGFFFLLKVILYIVLHFLTAELPLECVATLRKRVSVRSRVSSVKVITNDSLKIRRRENGKNSHLAVGKHQMLLISRTNRRTKTQSIVNHSNVKNSNSSFNVTNSMEEENRKRRCRRTDRVKACASKLLRATADRRTAGSMKRRRRLKTIGFRLKSRRPTFLKMRIISMIAKKKQKKKQQKITRIRDNDQI